MKFLSPLFLVLLIISCKKTEDPNSKNSVDEFAKQEITESDISKIKFTEFVLDSETEKITENWVEYNQLQEQRGYIKKGDLSFFSDNSEAIALLFKGLYDNIPEDIKENSILARIRSVETKTYKLESLANLSTASKTELQNGIKGLLVAMSNLDLQMNKIIELKKQNIIKP